MCQNYCGWLKTRFSSLIPSCTCCIDPSLKLQRDPLQADWEPGTHHNGIQGEQITPKIVNKAFIQKSKIIKFEILLRCACNAFVSTWFLATFEKSELQIHRYIDTHTDTQTYYRMPSAHVQ